MLYHYLALRENTRGQRVDYKGTTKRNPVNDTKQNIKPDRTKDSHLSETER